MPRLLPLVLVLGVAASCGSGSDPAAPPSTLVEASVRLVQYDIARFGDFVQTDSAYGGALVSFEGTEGVLFLNLALEAATAPDWQLHDVPVVGGCGGPQTVHLTVDLSEVQRVLGTQDVREVACAWTLSTRPVDRMPEAFRATTVEAAGVRFESGFTAGRLAPLGPPARRPVMTLPIGEIEADVGCHVGFPNQESGLYECVPVAVSNSLKFLGAGVGANDIEDCKALTGFTGTGVDYVWADTKEAATSGPPYDLVTKVLPGALGGQNVIFGHLRQVIDALQAGHDVELNSYVHCAAVVAAAELFLPGGSLFVVHVAHDLDQGVPGGLVVESLLYDPVENGYVGGFPLVWDQHYQFTIESP